MDGLASYDSDSSEVNADIRAQENLYKKSFEYGSHYTEHQLIPPSQNMDIYPSPPRLVSREDYANFTEPNDGNYDSPPLLSRSDSPSHHKETAMIEQYMKPLETNGAEYSMPGTSKQEPVEGVYLAPHMLENFPKTESNLNMLYEPEEPLPENYSPSVKEINVPVVVTQEQAAEKEGLNENLNHSHVEEKLSHSKSRSASKEMQSRSRSRSRSKEQKCARRKSRSKSHDRRSRSRDSRSKSCEKVYKSRSRRSRSKGRRSRSRGRRSRSKGTSRRRSRSGSHSKSSRRRSGSRSKGRRRSRSNSRSKKRSRRSRSHERRRKHRSGSHEHSSRRKPSRPLVDEFGRDLSSRKRSVSPPKGRTAIDHTSKAEKKYRPRSSENRKKVTSDEDSDHSPDSSPERKRSPKGKRKESLGRNLESPGRQLELSRERSRSPKKRERKHSQTPSPDRKSRSPRKRSRLRSSRSRTPRRRSRSRSSRRKSRSRSPVRRRHRKSRSHSRSPKYKRREASRRRSRSPRHHDRNSRSRSRSPFYGRGRRGGGGYDSAIHAQEALARRLEKAKKMQDQKRKELEESAANEPKRSADEIAKALSAQNLTGANAQVAFQAAYAELQAKALATTGIAVPSYYNPMAVNPLQYAAKAKKRQLLWSSKKTETAEKEESTTSSNQWEKTSFGDAATKEKFRRLMGIKADSANPQEEDIQKQEDERLKLFSQLDQEYQVARIKTHTQRSFGLGFAGHAAPPAPGPSTE